MPTLKIEIEYNAEDLEKAILFMHGNPEHTEQIKKDFFPATKI